VREPRQFRSFHNGRNQAVRKRGLITLLETMKPLDEDFPDIDDPVPALDEDKYQSSGEGPHQPGR
jgi:hypothetical protein